MSYLFKLTYQITQEINIVIDLLLKSSRIVISIACTTVLSQKEYNQFQLDVLCYTATLRQIKNLCIFSNLQLLKKSLKFITTQCSFQHIIEYQYSTVLYSIYMHHYDRRYFGGQSILQNTSTVQYCISFICTIMTQILVVGVNILQNTSTLSTVQYCISFLCTIMTVDILVARAY